MVNMGDDREIADVFAVHLVGIRAVERTSILTGSVLAPPLVTLCFSRARPAFILFPFYKELSMRRFAFALLIAISTLCAAQNNLSPTLKEFVKVDSPTIALTHVRVIDGTGAAARDDQTIV